MDSYSLIQGIVPIQVLNPGLLHLFTIWASRKALLYQIFSLFFEIHHSKRCIIKFTILTIFIFIWLQCILVAAQRIFSLGMQNLFSCSMWTLVPCVCVCMHVRTHTQSLSHVQLFCDLMSCRLPGSSVHGISQARILKQVAISFFRGSSGPRDQTLIFWFSCFGRQVLYYWAT